MLAADLAGVLELEHELFPDDAWTPEMFADEVSQPADSRLYLVAEHGSVRDPVADQEAVPDGTGVRGARLAGYAGKAADPYVRYGHLCRSAAASARETDAGRRSPPIRACSATRPSSTMC